MIIRPLVRRREGIAAFTCGFVSWYFLFILLCFGFWGVSFCYAERVGWWVWDGCIVRGGGKGGNTKAKALKKLMSYASFHSSGVLSAIFFTGARVPWLRIRESILVNDFRQRSIAFCAFCGHG